MVRISDGEEEKGLTLNEIKHEIAIVTQKIEALNASNKQVAIDILQESTDRLRHQLGSDEIPQLDGNSDSVIFCDFCNKDFIGDKRVRDRQTHYINEHLKSKFEEITPTKTENYFRCDRSECEFKTTKKLDYWRHIGGKHELLKLFVKEHFDTNPPLIPASGHIAINGEDRFYGHQPPMFLASHSTPVLSRPHTPSVEAAEAPQGLASLRYKLTSLPSVPSLQRETSLVSMASGQAGLSGQVSTPCLQPPEADMRSVRSNISDTAFSQAQASHTPIPGHLSHQNSLQQPHATPVQHPTSSIIVITQPAPAWCTT